MAKKAEADKARSWEKRLVGASRQGDLDLLEEALKNGADPNARQGEPLRQAAGQGHAALVARLLERGADPNLGRPQPLTTTILSQRWTAAATLLDGGAHCEDLQENKAQALKATRLAALSGDGALYRRLIERGLAIRADDPVVLRNAIWGGSLDIVGSILAFRAKYEGKNFDYFIAETNNLEILRLLLDHSAYAISLAKSGELRRAVKEAKDAALIRAVQDRDLERTRLLLERGADPDASGGRPLQLAINWDQAEIIELLRARNAESVPHETLNKLALWKAATSSDIGGIRAALADGTNPNAKTAGWPPLLRAAAEGQHLAVEYLASCGADAHIYQEAPLRHAAINGHLETVRVLLARGADARVLNSKPLRDAAKRGDLEMVRALLDAGADPNAKDGEPLRTAILASNLALVELVLERGADPDAAAKIPAAQKDALTSEMLEALERARLRRERQSR
jgi:cytohesin